MKILSTLLLAAALTALPTSCKSSDSSKSSSSATADIPCRCGTPLGDLEGCAHPLCRAGKANPQNPDCVCGQMDIPAGKAK